MTYMNSKMKAVKVTCRKAIAKKLIIKKSKSPLKGSHHQNKRLIKKNLKAIKKRKSKMNHN